MKTDAATAAQDYRKAFTVKVSHKTQAKPWHGCHCFVVQNDSARGFYATSKAFGCSKTYATPKDAIISMAAEAACDIISIVPY